MSGAYFPYSDEALLQYSDTLDWALDDHHITAEERRALADLAADLGLSESQVERAHRSYYDSIVAAVVRDHVVTAPERKLLARIATALDLRHPKIPDITELPSAGTIEAGSRVCFTGEATADGQAVKRESLEATAARAGLVPIKSVTKKNCDLLVAADPASTSIKAKKARDYRIPVISVTEFLAQVH